MIDKNQRMVDFLQTCPIIRDNPLFFNLGNVQDNANQITVYSDEKALQKPYIDGSVEMRYTYSIDSFKSVACIPILEDVVDENLADLSEVQSIMDWINEQGDAENFPDFGETCTVDKMYTLANKPKLVSVQSNLNPPIAIYRMTIQIDYLDNSKRIFN